MKLIIDSGEALDIIKLLFPRTMDQKNTALTGFIPIKMFNEQEDRIRPLMRAASLRAIYRGPRSKHCYQTMTHRADATGVFIYKQR